MLNAATASIDAVERASVVRSRLLRRMTAVHGIGAFAVFVYLQVVLPGNTLANDRLPDLATLIGLEAVLAPIAWLWGRAQLASATRFIVEQRPATEDEVDHLLSEPRRLAGTPIILWMVAAIVSAVVSSVTGQLDAGGIADQTQIVLIGGLATCGLSYLIAEQTFRPLFAVALAGRPPRRNRSLDIRSRLLLAWAVGTGVPLLGLALAPIRQVGTSTLAVSVLAVIGLLGGFGAVFIAANSIAAPLDEVRRSLIRIAEGDLNGTVVVDDGGDVGQVQAGLQQMVDGLRERQRIHDLFGRHVGVEVAAQALERGAGLGGEQHRASVIFVDLIGSTAMAEVLPPSEVVSTLNAFFQAVVDTIQREGGWVNKFEGDGALCVFGVPAFQPDHEARALRSARRLRDRLRELAFDYPGLEAGIGVSSGLVVAGNVGTEERFEYTVIGRAVNQAARLTDLAKERNSRVLASATTVNAAGHEAENWVDRGRVGLRGQSAPTVIFEPRSAPITAPTHSVPEAAPTDN